MITALKPKIDLHKEALAYTIDKNLKTPAVGQKVKLYIPIIMANIPQEDESKDYKIITKGTSIFKNAPSCMPKINSTLTAQNYIECECENNTNWDGTDSVVLDGKGAVKNRTINNKTKLAATFTNGKFKSITFNTNKYSSDSILNSKYTSTSRYSGDVQLSNIKESTSDVDYFSLDISNMVKAIDESSEEIRIPDVDSINNAINILSRDMQTMQKTLNTLLERLESSKTISVDQSKRW